MTLREEIEAYLDTFHEGADQQRYHLENFMRWREPNSHHMVQSSVKTA